MGTEWREILRSNIGPETLISISLAGPLGPDEYELLIEYLRLMKRSVAQPATPTGEATAGEEAGQ